MISGVPFCADCYFRVESETKYISWEDRTGEVSLLKRFWRTIHGVLFRPSETFRRMPLATGQGMPILFVVIISEIYVVFMALNMALQMTLMPGQRGFSRGGPAALGGGILLLILLVVSPLATILSSYVAAGLHHISLRILGVAREDFEATFRTYCYASATMVWGFIPWCGGCVIFVWWMVAMIIGYREVHRTSGGMAALAVLLPGIVLGLLFGGVFALLIGFAVWRPNG